MFYLTMTSDEEYLNFEIIQLFLETDIFVCQLLLFEYCGKILI